MHANVLAYPVHTELPKVANNSQGCQKILYVFDWSHSCIFSISNIDV